MKHPEGSIDVSGERVDLWKEISTRLEIPDIFDVNKCFTGAEHLSISQTWAWVSKANFIKSSDQLTALSALDRDANRKLLAVNRAYLSSRDQIESTLSSLIPNQANSAIYYERVVDLASKVRLTGEIISRRDAHIQTYRYSKRAVEIDLTNPRHCVAIAINTLVDTNE